MPTEPRVSEPRPITHMPSATATAAPDDEPPGDAPFRAVAAVGAADGRASGLQRA